MSKKFWANAFSVALMLGMLASLIQPGTTLAAPAFQKTGPYTTPNGFVISEPVAPADNSDLPIPAPVEPRGKASAGLNSNFPLPKTSEATKEDFADTVLQSQPGLPNTPAKISDFEGIGNLSGVLPPDTDGQVGPNDYVQLINATNVGIYDKASGTLKYSIFSLGSLWPAGDACAADAGDPVVLYDQMADRWILSQFNFPNYPSGNYYECFAISKTGQPTNLPANWWTYSFAVHATKMNDYPKIGIWPDGYYMTVNQFTNASNWGGAGVFVFDRLAMLNGQAATFQYFDLYPVNNSYGGMLPASLMGDTLPPAGAPNYFVEVDQDWSGTDDILHVFAFHVDWNNPANSTFQLKKELIVAPFQMLCPGTRKCIDQPGYPTSLDAIGDRLMMHAWYRNFGDHETMQFNHTVDVGGGTAGIRWYEIRKTAPAADAWGIFQQGTFSPDGNNRWMGSIAMDHVGNMALGYSVSSDTIYPSVRYAGRLATDPLGTLGNEQSIIEGGGAQTHTAARWGDYSAMSVDPLDDCTFWFTQEYIPVTTPAGWHTRIGSFKFPSCSKGPTGTLEGTVKNAANNALIQGAVVSASGPAIPQDESAVTGADGKYSMVLPEGIYQVSAAAFGFQPASASNVQVVKDTITTRNFSLNSAPKHTVSGKVTDANTGWALYAHITVSGDPINPPADSASAWTDPETGNYSIALPEGINYSFHAVAFVPGYTAKDVVVGLLAADKTVNIQLAIDPDSCSAPGYHITGGIQSTFSTAVLPAGWAVIDNLNNQKVWSFNNPGGRANNTGGTGNFAIVDSDHYGQGVSQDTELRTPAYNFTGVSNVPLQFKYDFYYYNGETADVDVSNDSGATWTNVWRRTASDRGPKTASLDISAIAGNHSNVVVRFHYYNASYEWWWEVDDVSLGAPQCLANAGGLVVGNVTDANTGAGLNGANVSNESGYATTSLATPDDPAVPDGFYTLFSYAGPYNFTAGLTNYQTNTANVSVAANSTIRHDFVLQAGKLTFTPPSLTATVQLGQSTSKKLTTGNAGNVSASYEIFELNKGASPLGPIEQTTSLMPREWRRDFPDALHNGMIYTMPVAPPYAAGDVIQSWNPGHFPWGIAYDPVDNSIWVNSPSSAWGGDDRVYEYQTDGVATGRSYPNASPHTNGPADMATNWNTGKIWTMNVSSGEANCIYEIDPASGYTGNFICPGGGTGFAVSQRGLAYDPTTDSWFAGSWNDQKVYHFTSDGTILDSVNVGLAISGLAYNPDTGHLFAIVNSTASTVYVLDTANTYAKIGQFNIAGMSGTGGAGLEIDCDGNLWAADQVNKLVFQVKTGEPATVCASDVPWLGEAPTAGNLSAHASADIQVTFNAGVPEITQPGEYHASLLVENNTPYGKIQIPVTMTVTAPAAYSKIKGTVTKLSHCDADPIPFMQATVNIQGSGGFTQTLKTNAEGYYQLWLDHSRSPLNITISHPGYKTVQATGVNLSSGQIFTKDASLRLLQPCAKVDPGMLSVEVGKGYSLTLPEKLLNLGAAGTSFNLYEVPAFLAPQPAGVVTPGTVSGSSRQLELSVSNQAPAGPVKPWAPNGPIALSVDDGSAETSVGLNGGGQMVWLNRFTPEPVDFPFVLTEISALFTGGSAAGDDIELLVYSDADGNPANGATFLYSENVQVQHNDGTTWNTYLLASPVFIAGPGDVLIGMVNRSGAPGYGDYPAAIDTSSGSKQRSWVGISNSGNPSEPPVLPLDIFNTMDNFGLAGNWILRGSGYTGVLDIPWLSETPSAGTINADSNLSTQVTFSALVTMTKGTYDGILRLKTEDPISPTIDVPVQMTIVDPGFGVTLSPDQAHTGVPGSTITYDIALTNSSNGPTDSFDLSLGSHAWTTNLLTPATVGPMAAGETKTVKVAVHVPDNAKVIDSDVVTLKATSKHDSTVRDFIDLTSSATGNYSVAVTPPVDAKSGTIGTTVDYRLHITNNSALPDSYTISLNGNAWVVNTGTTPVNLAAGAGVDIIIHVTIPKTALLNDSDSVTATVTSTHDPSVKASAFLTTTAGLFKLSLPFTTSQFAP